MHKTPRKPQRIVITGASSGIGMATALAFADQGASLILVSRNAGKLQDVVLQCRERGGEASFVEADVTDPKEVKRVTFEAVKRLGGIDVWVNDAGIGTVGAYADSPLESHLQVVRTNLLGYMHGAYYAVREFQKQGHGILINLNSLGAWIPIPYAASYSASKFGLLGFMEALRAELRDQKDIHICDIMPSFVDTPGFTHGANYSGTGLRPMPPLTAPETVARHVLRCAAHPRDRDAIGLPVFAARTAYFLAPRLTMRLMKSFLDAAFHMGSKAAPTDGAIFRSPRESAQVSGGHRWGTTARLTALVAGGVVLYALRSAFSDSKTRRPYPYGSPDQNAPTSFARAVTHSSHKRSLGYS